MQVPFSVADISVGTSVGIPYIKAEATGQERGVCTEARAGAGRNVPGIKGAVTEVSSAVWTGIIVKGLHVHSGAECAGPVNRGANAALYLYTLQEIAHRRHVHPEYFLRFGIVQGNPVQVNLYARPLGTSNTQVSITAARPVFPYRHHSGGKGQGKWQILHGRDAIQRLPVYFAVRHR